MQKRQPTTPMLMMMQPQQQRHHLPFPLGADGGGLHCARTGVPLFDVQAMFTAGKNELVARTKDTLKSGVDRALQFRERIPGFREAADTLHMAAGEYDQSFDTAGSVSAGRNARFLHTAGSWFAPDRGSQWSTPQQDVHYR